jgi:hypothetical protein
MSKARKIFSRIILFTFLSFVFISCKNLFNSENDEVIIHKRKAKVSVSADFGKTRTVLPTSFNGTEQGYTWNLLGKKSTEEENRNLATWKDEDNKTSYQLLNETKDILIDEGTWNFELTVSKLDTTGNTVYVLYSKIENVNIKSGVENSLHFSMEEATSSNLGETAPLAKGVINFTLNFPSGIVNDVQVLVPMYKGSVGIDAFNFYMQEKFNPQTKDNLKQIIIGNRKFRVNDKVIQLVNRAEKGVMNGDIGYISRIEGDFNNYTGLYIQYSFRLVYYEINELDDISLAYAISIHKAQGSEFKLVIMPLSFKYYIMLKKKLVYTAITRAKNYLFMIGNFEAFRKGVINIEEKRRTRLEYKIKQLINNPNILLDNESGFSEIIIDDIEILNPYDFMD